MEQSDFTFEAGSNGYMLFYKRKPIGGAGVKLPRERPLHWKHARANVRMFNENARDEISALCAGRGQSRFVDAINRIES